MKSFSVIRTTSENPDFIRLVSFLDAYLADIDGPEHAFYAQFNQIDVLRHVVIAYHNKEAVGCGAFKKYDDQTIEIKRMYTVPFFRGKGIAGLILDSLEGWAAALGFQYAVLETGLRQQEAVRLYQKNGYQLTENYGPYTGMPNSVCFKKTIIADT